MKLTKTDYLLYLECPREFWLEKNHNTLSSQKKSEIDWHEIKVGYEVEQHAREIFPSTEKQRVEFQREFESENLFARADIFVSDKLNGETAIYEVKGTSEVKKDHLDDLAFQKIAAEGAGVKVSKTFLVHLNKDYVKSGDLDYNALFVKEDLTDQVNAILDETRERIEQAHLYANAPEPENSLRNYCKARKLECAFIRRHHKKLPEYTIFDINRFYGKKLDELLDMNVIDIRDVPKDFPLSPNARAQVDIAQRGEILINREKIRERLDELRFPLYFLDYETLGHAIPLFDGYAPFQNIVFQFSLHVKRESGGELEHHEFLGDASREPAVELVRTLKEKIADDGGSVIVWYESFEKTRNDEMGALFPDFAEFLNSVNARVFDLMKIFSEGFYSDPRCKGSNSIKNVLPVIAPHLSYKDLEINHGLLASINWLKLHREKLPHDDGAKISADLREYCKLDTKAMVEIFEFLQNLTI